jgi:hypothetical protein
MLREKHKATEVRHHLLIKQIVYGYDVFRPYVEAPASLGISYGTQIHIGKIRELILLYFTPCINDMAVLGVH